MRRTVLILTGLLVIGFSQSVSAQTLCANPCTLIVGQSYAALADHDGVNTTGYRFILDGAQAGADLPMSALSGGVVTVGGQVAPARGSHSLQIVAFNEDGSAASSALPFSVKKQPPGKPNNPRIFSVLLSPFRFLANMRRKSGGFVPVTITAARHADGSVTFQAVR